MIFTIDLMKMRNDMLVTSKLTIKPDVSSSAQSSGLLTVNDAAKLLSDSAMIFIYSDNGYPLLFKYLVYLLLVSGCRISEALNVRGCDVTGCYRIVLHGSKGSNNRVVFLPLLSEGGLGVTPPSVLVWGIYSRFYVYRVLKKHGIYLSKEGNKNMAVTHSFRNAVAAELQLIVGSTAEKSIALGHKSQKSRQYYERKIFK